MQKIIKKILKRIPVGAFPVILCVLMACVLVYMFTLRINAKSLGAQWGENLGEKTGWAIGSFDGLTKGIADGTAAGQAAGGSAEDTEAEIANKMRQLSNIEVLVASVKLRNFHSIGKKIDYAALYLVNGNIVFTVDMSKAEVSKQADGLHIILPKPTGTLYLDDSSVEKVAEYQRRYFTGEAEVGFDAYLNTMARVQNASEETLSNYPALLTSAKQAAERQITLLAQAVSTTENVVITFAE